MMKDFKTLFAQNCFAPDQQVSQTAAEQLESRFNCEINCVEIDPTVQFAHHGKGCTIAAAKISAHVVIFQNVTIGSNMKFNLSTQEWEQLGNPVIGHNVVIADGAKVLGPIIIGDNSVIGAGAIITKSVPANSVAYGVNQIKAKSASYDLVFHDPMPKPAEIITACQEVIDQYQKAK